MNKLDLFGFIWIKMYRFYSLLEHLFPSESLKIYGLLCFIQETLKRISEKNVKYSRRVLLYWIYLDQNVSFFRNDIFLFNRHIMP